MDGNLLLIEDFELDPHAYHLRRSGRSLKLERIPMELLLLLVERRGQLVTREEIIGKLWGKNVFLDTDNAINTAIRKIRQILNDDPEQPRFIQTVTGRGYRFIAQVAEVSEPPAGQAAAVETLPIQDQPDRRSRYSPRFVVPLAAVLALAVLGAGYLVRPHLFVKSATPHGRVMLAVLPFQNLSNVSDQEYFSDGLTEEAITDLGKLSPEKLGVISRTSAMAYKHTQKSASQIGQELGVDYILEGSVRREGERVRISAQLIRVQDQTHVWAQSYDRDMRDFLAVQNELGGAIAGQVQVSLTPEQKREQSKIPHIDPEAYDDYLKGRYYADKITREDFEKAIDFFQKAIDKDPSYASAYGELARSFTMQGFSGYLPTAEAYPKAIAAAKRAIEMDDNLAEGHVALGHALLFLWNWAGAERELRRAIELNPNLSEAHREYAVYWAATGRLTDALREAQAAEQLDPLSTAPSNVLALVYFFRGEYDRSLLQWNKSLDMTPNSSVAHINLFEVYRAKSMYDKAVAELEAALRLEGQNQRASSIENGFKEGGFRGAMLERIRSTERARATSDGWDPVDIAESYLLLGDRDRAFVWLNRAYEAHSGLLFLKVDPGWDPIHSDPRYADLLNQMGLPQ